MRRVVPLAALTALALAAPAWGAEGVTLSAQPSVVAYDGFVRFSGATVPLSDVFLVQRLPSGWTVIAQTTAGTDGGFAFERRGRKPGVFQARTVGGQSGEVATRVRPRLRARLAGSILTGRVLPARAGSVLLRVQGRTRRLRVGSAGRFRARLRVLRAGRHAVRVSVRPAPGYVQIDPPFRVAHPSSEPPDRLARPGSPRAEAPAGGARLRPALGRLRLRVRNLRGGHGFPEGARAAADGPRRPPLLASPGRRLTSPARGSRAATISRSASPARRSTRCGTDRSSA